MKGTNLKYCGLIIILSSLASCKLTQVVPDGEKLLIKNNIIGTDNAGVDFSEERRNLKQKPNREILNVFKFHLWAYQYGNKGVGGKKRWLRRGLESIGEPPVLIDTALSAQSAARLSEYYFSKGFFNNKVTYNVVPKKRLIGKKEKKKARVDYNVKLGRFQVINKVEYNATSFDIDQLVEDYKSQSYLIPNKRLDFEYIEKERTRLTTLLRDNGFYYFNNAFVDFQLDTNKTKGRVDVVVNIRNDRNFQPHYQQRIEKIVVRIENNEKENSGIGVVIYDSAGMIITENSYGINAPALIKNIYVKADSLYNASEVQETYSNLLGMGLFKFVTIRFYPSPTDSAGKLIMRINLETAPKHDFTWEPQLISSDQSGGVQATTERNFGLANTLKLRNRNVFGNGEAFNISSFTALESQLKNDGIGFFNSFRQNLSTDLSFPSLLYFERKSQVVDELTRKSTHISLTFLHDRNVNFTRNLFPLSLRYEFTRSDIKYYVTPFRINLNQAKVDADFLTSLDPITRVYTTQLLTNNIITGPLVSASWNNTSERPKHYWKVRTTPIEFSGNLFSLGYAAFSDQTGLNKEIFGIKYSQYARSEADATLTHVFNENSVLATRFYGGIGIPYGNTNLLPFERRFFVGGGNSLRAWRPRTIGPGSYTDASNTIAIEKTGEILLQGNIEYRFGMINRLLDGALFMDVGNIWNLRENTDFVNAEFKANRFYKELALNTGFGLRVDLEYVIFRIDWGVALHDPSLQPTERWIISEFFNQKEWVNDNSALNFAVGYPF